MASAVITYKANEQSVKLPAKTLLAKEEALAYLTEDR